jgi:hypothetical protein
MSELMQAAATVGIAAFLLFAGLGMYFNSKKKEPKQ